MEEEEGGGITTGMVAAEAVLRQGGMEGGIRGGGGVGRRWPPVVEREAEGAERSGRAFSSEFSPLTLCNLSSVQAECTRIAAVSSRALSEVCFSGRSPVSEREREGRRQVESNVSLF